MSGHLRRQRAFASGVKDAQKRKNYLARLDKLEAGARKTIASAKTDAEKGEKLLQYLHAKALAQGYRAQQTDLSVLLDTGTFNCVSSAVIYNIIGRRLGLDLRAIEVPDHAFSILYIGTKHADVETTNELGFNPSRDPAIQKELLEQTGFRYIADRHPEQRREVDEAGLAAIIYYNHGVQASQEKRYGEALFAYFRALSLDPEFTSSVKNVLAALANWSVELADAKQFEQALAVVNTGLDLAPKDATLINNRKAIWGERVEAAMDAGENDRALALLQDAHKQAPDGNFRAMQSWVFLRPAEKFVKQSQWNEALAVAETGIPKVDEDARKELVEWRQGLFLRWSNAQLDQKQYSQAIAVLERGLKIEPENSRMLNNVGYVAQVWVKDALKQHGPEEAEAVLTALLKKHGNVETVKNAANSYVIRLVNRLRDEKQYAAALQVIKRCQSFLTDDDSAMRLAHNLYDTWAGRYIKEKKWQEALKVYAAALKQYPTDEHFAKNSLATWNVWAQKLMKAGKWNEAADVYAQAMEKFPQGDFDRRLAYLTQEWSKDALKNQGPQGEQKVVSKLLKRFSQLEEVREAAFGHYQRTVAKLVKDKKYQQALDTAERGSKTFNDEKPFLDVTHYVYDRWSRNLADDGKWDAAIDVYAQGLKRTPKDTYLTEHAIATWNMWARTQIDKKDWSAAIKTFEKALKKYPDSEVLQHNLQYCQQQQKKAKS